MRQPEKTTNGDFEEGELVGEGELDVEEFIGSMEGESAKSAKPLPERAGWRRVDDWQDARRLRQQLTDWDDWTDGDTD